MNKRIIHIYKREEAQALCYEHFDSVVFQLVLMSDGFGRTQFGVFQLQNIADLVQSVQNLRNKKVESD